MKYKLVVGLLLYCFGGLSQLPQGIFVQNQSPKVMAIPPFEEVSMPVSKEGVTLKIAIKDTLATISKYIYGTNANQYSGTLNQETKLIEYLKKLQPNLIRYPGGLHSDEFFWNVEWDWNLKNPDGKTAGWYKNLPKDLPIKMIKNGKIEPTGGLDYGFWVAGKGSWTFGVDDYYDFLQKTGSEGLITVNYGYARYGTGLNPVQTAAHLAADWVRYDKGRTKFWEIGNENVATWSGSYQIIKSQNQDGQPEILTPELYGRHCRVFIDSMKKAAKEVGAEIYIGIQNDEGALSGAGNSPDWLLDHTYYTNYQENATLEAILNSPFAETRKYAEKALIEAKRWNTSPKPTTMTEWNIFAEGSKQASSYINGMHLVLVLGEMMKNQYAMATRWDIANGWGTKGDDMGMFSGGDDPDGKLAKWNPRPAFYYQYYLQKFMGNHLVNTFQAGNNQIVGYASGLSDGKIGLVVVNKSRTAEIAKIEVPDWQGIKRFYQYSLTGGTDNGNFSLKVLINGIGPSTTQIGGPIEQLDNIKAQSALVFEQMKIALPPLSVQYVLIESGKNIALTTNQDDTQTIEVYPNPFKELIQIRSMNRKITSFEILHISGIHLVSGKVIDNKITLHNGLKQGVYILKLFYEKGVFVQKIIAE
jgi:hypothetical protein